MRCFSLKYRNNTKGCQGHTVHDVIHHYDRDYKIQQDVEDISISRTFTTLIINNILVF